MINMQGGGGMTDLLLFTINAGYVHPSMGLWYLRANLCGDAAFVTGPDPGGGTFSVDILEVTRRAGRGSIIAEVLRRQPRVLAVGLYIWNHLDVVPVLQAVRDRLPETVIVLGGPEASHLPDGHPTLALADGVVKGEAELVFGALVEELLAGPAGAGQRDGGPAGDGRRGAHPTGGGGWRADDLRGGGMRSGGWRGASPPTGATVTAAGHWVLEAVPPDLDVVRLPHQFFTDHDIRHRFMYMEASRGCPFRCQFCLSSLDRKIRTAPLEPLFDMADYLVRRGADRFKFIDRTFNLDFDRAAAVLEFWLQRLKPGMSVQFETVPDRFPPELRDLIRRFPEGSLRLEVGVQTFNPDVAGDIDRRSDLQETERTLTFLSDETGAVVHADLIVGLPGESLESFAAGFDRLHHFGPGEVQVGILKRLPGAPIAVHDGRMRYNPDPPYDVLETDALSAVEVEGLKRFAKYWELVVNRGRFPERVARLLGGGADGALGGGLVGASGVARATTQDRAPGGGGPAAATGLAPGDKVARGGLASHFHRFREFSEFAWRRFGRTWGLTPEELRGALDEFLAG